CLPLGDIEMPLISPCLAKLSTGIAWLHAGAATRPHSSAAHFNPFDAYTVPPQELVRVCVDGATAPGACHRAALQGRMARMEGTGGGRGPVRTDRARAVKGGNQTPARPRCGSSAGAGLSARSPRSPDNETPRSDFQRGAPRVICR